MKVSLIRPPSYSVGFMGAQLVPYLGVAYIAASVRNAGHSVDIIDMCGEDIDHSEIIRVKYVAYGMPLTNLKNRIKNTDVIGFTCMFSQDWEFHKELINYVGDLFPKSILVAGGEHITALPEFCLNDCKSLDICVVGEADHVFVNLLNIIDGPKIELSTVESLVYRKNGIIESTTRSNRIEDIDSLPLPAWDLMPINNYLSRNLNYHVQRGRTLPILATRGCPFNCNFCSNNNMWSTPWIHRNPKLIVQEMKYHIDKYKVNNFVFSDLSAVIDKGYIFWLCNEIINSKINITFQLPTLRTEILDKELLDLMYRAGCRELDFAIESASNIVLKNAGKKNDPLKMVKRIGESLKIGFNLSVNIVIGLPKENLKEFLKTYYMVIKLALKGLQEINVFPFIPYPGSTLFNEYLKDKTIILTEEYFLSLFSYGDISKAISFSKQFSPRTLHFLRWFTICSFYSIMFLTHPIRIFRLIKNIIQKKKSTKLENVLARVIKNVKLTSRYGTI